jgi:hypothetical protein
MTFHPALVPMPEACPINCPSLVAKTGVLDAEETSQVMTTGTVGSR